MENELNSHLKRLKLGSKCFLVHREYILLLNVKSVTYFETVISEKLISLRIGTQ